MWPLSGTVFDNVKFGIVPRAVISTHVSFRIVFFRQLVDFNLNLQEGSPEHSALIITDITNVSLLRSKSFVTHYL